MMVWVAEAHWFLGCLLYDSQDFTNALVEFRKSVELDDSYDNSRFRIWLIRARSDEKDAAAKELQIYLDNRTKENLGDWHYKIGSFLAGQLTESDFLDAAANFDSAKDLGTSAGRLCEAYFYAGSKRLFAGDKDIAADDFEKSIATNQKGYQEYFSAAAELKFLQAEKIQAEKLSVLEAIAEAKARLRVAEPAVIPQTNAVALITADDYVKSGVAKYYQGDVDGSIADFTKAIELKPDSADAYNKRAIAKFKKSDVDGSIADLSQAITLNPNNALAYYDRGIARKSKHEYDGAIADYNRAIQLDPNNPDAYIRLAWILSTCPQAGSRDGKKAVAAATKACELSGWKVPAMLDTLAAACAEAGDFDSAVKWEGKYRETPNLGASEDARTEVVLGAYQAHLPYRESN
jgi:lipoprotein NlpI